MTVTPVNSATIVRDVTFYLKDFLSKNITDPGNKTVDYVKGGVTPIPVIAGQAGYFFTDNQYDWDFDIYAWKIIDGVKIFTDTPTRLSMHESVPSQLYYFNLNWDAVDDVDGYRIMIVMDFYNNFFVDHYIDTTDNFYNNYGNGTAYLADIKAGSTITPTKSRTSGFVNTSYPTREVKYPIITIKDMNMSSDRLGFQSQAMATYPEMEIRTWGRTVAERDKIADSIFQKLKDNQIGAGSTSQTFNLHDFKLVSTVNVDETDGPKSKIQTYKYLFVAI